MLGPRQKTLVVISEDDETAFVSVPMDWKVPLLTCSDVPALAMATCCPVVSLAKVLSLLSLAPFGSVLVLGAFYVVSLLGALANVIWHDASPSSVLFMALLSLVPTVVLFNLRVYLRELLSLPSAEWSDAGAALCCAPCLLAQASTQVGVSPCDCSDNATLVAFPVV
ncbi:hypothetical protein SPRG_12821 [Saprolegnia parasitica CBS 223.65]|uniref:Transmembrane protein n=1 Tax=Saprolegnia parasitica (strain CBS 223.65) TaxID=695850 RepID=A0A067C559_SAPPC|nr:hypothetical protein SPRG_12821 [Saprolegnia parasitica CBS 223.65]KDO21957.1 hypothetical protein SPRG_12821 [Saprolegnia parasitica CBS 223.65]|eukprot:XP_012207299.1 hypothetical protein SPRG_12821 [Saprolegnia parasitica CBS 223.65]